MFKTVNEAMTAICNAIRSYNNTSDKLNLDEIASAITDVHSNGHKDGYLKANDGIQSISYKLQKRLEDNDEILVKDLEENVDTAIADFDNIKSVLVNQTIEVPDGTPTSEYYAVINRAFETIRIQEAQIGYRTGYNERSEKIYEKLDETIQITSNLAHGGEGDPGHSVESQITFLNTNIPNVQELAFQEGKDEGRLELDQTIAQINSKLETTVGIANNYLPDGEVPVIPWDKITYLDEKIPEVYEKGKQDGMATNGYSVKIEDGVLIVRNLIDEVNV